MSKRTHKEESDVYRQSGLNALIRSSNIIDDLVSKQTELQAKEAQLADRELKLAAREVDVQTGEERIANFTNDNKRTIEETTQRADKIFKEAEEKVKKLEDTQQNLENCLGRHKALHRQVVVLDVGGVMYKTTVATLCLHSKYFKAVFSDHVDSGDIAREHDGDGLINQAQDGQEHGCKDPLFIDRDGTTFKLVLQFMRSGQIPRAADLDLLAQEAKYFDMPALEKELTAISGEQKRAHDVLSLIAYSLESQSGYGGKHSIKVKE